MMLKRLPVAGVRLLMITIPAGFILVAVTTVLFFRVVPGDRLHPTFAFSLVMALGVGAFSVALSASMRRLTLRQHDGGGQDEA